MLRNAFDYKLQCELSCPKSAQKVSGLSRNARQSFKVDNYCLMISENLKIDIYFLTEGAFIPKFWLVSILDVSYVLVNFRK